MMFEACLTEQAALHPALQPQDAVKLCYQAAFGAEHFLEDREMARQLLTLELESVQPSSGRLWEPIGPHYARVNLAVWKKKGLSAEALFRLFCQSASEPDKQNSEELFRCYLKIVEKAAQEDKLSFTVSDWQQCLKGYFAQGGGAVHHSPRYRREEQPRYRLIHQKHLFLFLSKV
jgi:hypothetical protein